MIKNIPIPIVPRYDSWFWLLDDTGKFTVKSCYRKFQGKQRLESATFMRKLWSFDLPGKIISFMWCVYVCRACLPTALDLKKKRVEVNSMCSWCVCREEDAIHMLFERSFA